MNATVDTVARTLWGEARGEGVAGMQAVANVIMNRVALQKRYFGLNPVGVCKAENQFTCWNRGSTQRSLLLAVTAADPQFAEALDLAEEAIAGTLPDLTHGAVHYFVRTMKPWPHWSVKLVQTAIIGAHVFFRLPC